MTPSAASTNCFLEDMTRSKVLTALRSSCNILDLFMLSLTRLLRPETRNDAILVCEIFKTMSLHKFSVDNSSMAVNCANKCSKLPTGLVSSTLILVPQIISILKAPSGCVSSISIDEQFKFRHWHKIKLRSSTRRTLLSRLLGKFNIVPLNSNLVGRESPRLTISYS